MALVLSSPMAPSVLLRSPPQPSPSPSPTSTPLPALTADLSSSSSSSTSGSCLDLHQSSSLPSTRRIRFAPLPDPRRDELVDQIHVDEAQPTSKPTEETLPPPPLPDGFVLSPSISPDSSISSAQSTPTIRVSRGTSSQNGPAKPNSKLLRPFSFLRRLHSSSPNQSPLSEPASLPSSCNASVSSFNRATSSAPNSPNSQPSKLSRISAEDILTFGTKSLFRSRSGSGNGNRPRAPSPPPGKLPDANKSLHRAASARSGAGMKLGHGKRDWGDGSVHSQDSDTAGSDTRPRRPSSSSLTPGSGGGRHTSSTKMLSDEPRRPSTSPSLAAPKKHVKMLNGRVYGAKRYATQTLANPFANVRDDPEFVEWGYGGMGSVHASAGIANDIWKGLQRSERGGALLAGTSFEPSSASHRATPPAGSGAGGGSDHPHPPAVRRKMLEDVPECGMGNVGAGAGVEDDDGSGMGWVKRRRAEREAKARLEQAAKGLEQKEKEGRKSGDSMDAGMASSIISTTASLTASTSVTTTDVTTPATSPLCSRSASVTDLSSKSSPSPESHEVPAAPPSPASREPVVASHTSPSQLSPAPKDEHHVLTAVRLSPKLSHKRTHSHGRTPSLSHSLKVGESDDQGETLKEIPSSPMDTEEMAASTSFSGDDEDRLDRDSDEDQEQEQVDDDEAEAEAGEVARKTALGAGVEKISRHVDVEAR